MSENILSDAEKIEILKAGQASAFWGIITQITRENIEVLETQILDKVSLEDGHESEALTDEEVDRLRDKRSAMIEVLALPEVIMADLRREDQEEEEDLDPFRQHKPTASG